MGEYAYLLEDIDTEVVLEKVTALLGSKFEEPDTCGWVVAAVTKLVSQLGHLPENVQSHIAVHLTSTATDVQQVRTITFTVSRVLCVANATMLVSAK